VRRLRKQSLGPAFTQPRPDDPDSGISRSFRERNWKGWGCRSALWDGHHRAGSVELVRRAFGISNVSFGTCYVSPSSCTMANWPFRYRAWNRLHESNITTGDKTRVRTGRIHNPPVRWKWLGAFVQGNGERKGRGSSQRDRRIGLRSSGLTISQRPDQ
jgi:hypothetical protein